MGVLLSSPHTTMTSKKRSVSQDPITTAMNSDASQTGENSIVSSTFCFYSIFTGQKRRACSKCRSAKVRCEFHDGASACRRCTEKGFADGCIPLESHTRSRGKTIPGPPPSDPSAAVQIQVRQFILFELYANSHHRSTMLNLKIT